MKRTLSGRIVYNRKPHVFSGRDLTRIVTAVSNNFTGSLINWKYVLKIAEYNVLWRTQEDGLIPKEDKFLTDMDELVRLLNAIGTELPAFGWFVDLAADIYWAVREKLL